MELFDFIKILFEKSDPKKWNSVSSYEKSKFQFMLNRFMSIKYPVNAQALNAVKTPGLGVAETWRSVAGRFYGDKVPSFIYTKVSGRKNSGKTPAIDKYAVYVWCEKHECGDREFYEALDFDEKSVLAELDYITKNFNEKKDKDEQV